MFAVISDIHSNLEALTTVLADVEKRGVKTIYCLGDVIGYGPNPRECLDLIIQKTKWCVLGNHDYAVFYEPTNFNYGAEQASFWTRFSLEAERQANSRNRRWSFLGELPMRRTLKTKLRTNAAIVDFVHASPRKPINEYIFPDDVYTNPLKVRLLFEKVKHSAMYTRLPIGRRPLSISARSDNQGTGIEGRATYLWMEMKFTLSAWNMMLRPRPKR
jgi:hypothetical protein